MDFLSTVASFFRGGGPFMYVILAAAVMSLAIMIERFIVIGRASSVNGGKLIDDSLRALAKRDFAAARNVCKSVNAPSAKVALAILETGSTDEAKLQRAADNAATLALPPLARRLPHLNMLANTATLLGLLGTIFGLTTAFSAVGAADPAQRSAFLAAGISQALSTTAFGLIVAVPTLLMHGFLVGKVEGVVEQVDEVAVKLMRAVSHPVTSAAQAQRPETVTGAAPRPAAAPRRGAA